MEKKLRVFLIVAASQFSRHLGASLHFHSSRAFHFARLVPLHRDVFTRLSSYNFLPRIGTATSISKLLARTINSPPPLSREYTPPKMATTRVALKKDLHVWSLLPSFVVPFLGFISFRNKVWEVRDERTMNIFGRIDI